MSIAKNDDSYQFVEVFAPTHVENGNGQYVAIVGRGVVAHGKDGMSDYDKAQKFPDQRVLVAQVPLRETMVLWLACVFRS